MALDLTMPQIAWNNLLIGATYAITTGSEDSANPLANAWSGYTSLPAILRADAAGNFNAAITTTQSQIPFGNGRFGWGPFGGIYAADALIIGGSRHNSAAQHWTGGAITINSTYTHPMVEPGNISIIIPFDQGVVATGYTIAISGLAANQSFIIPEMFLGPILEMPAVDLGFDPSLDAVHSTKFISVSGYRYDTVRYIQRQARPKWSVLDRATASMIDMFREAVVELMQPFWWMCDPAGNPQPILVKHVRPTAPMPWSHAGLRSFDLDLEEVLR